MSSARFWRVSAVETVAGGDLALSELRLHGQGGPLDASVLPTCSHAPISGSIAALQDGDLTTVCRWGGQAVRSSGFRLVWDFGRAVSVIGVRIGSAADPDLFLVQHALEYFDGARWVMGGMQGRYAWPGANALTAAPVAGDPTLSSNVLLLDGQAFSDRSASAHPVNVQGAVQLSSERAPFGGSSMLFPGSGTDYAVVPSSADFAFGAGDYTIEAWIWLPSAPSGGYAAITDIRSSPGGNGATLFKLNSGRQLGLYYSGEVNTSITVPLQQWSHVAVARAAGTSRLFIDGQVGAVFSEGDTKIANHCYIGRVYDAAHPAFNGYLGALRIKKGVGLYTDTFTPPNAPWPLQGGGSSFLPLPLRTRAPRQLVLGAEALGDVDVVRGPGSAPALDTEFGGRGRIWGDTAIKGTPEVPARARVVLLRQRDKLLARETWSDPQTGHFEFAGIDVRQQFLVLVEDAAGNYRPVAASRLVPEAA
ncbi:LamG domain-containing protein [Paracidovorax cattleyae]|uniref:Concanavalin A-like lectin/glucanases superfamily protein n=1 Tax=Paracidovorax cattleyae TaxID=80868 RepID=A0A1H0N1K1_9BURK|nr:LamG domain-containing protein [Paracidovorax cattleyae]AVS75637.1 hypothetical protein C8240_18060 [Paracidovorax cattleyae]SDO86609.1 Concanavalin A-like lectin/glucanases superfamily protein [Paracidovorax cattleyae]